MLSAEETQRSIDLLRLVCKYKIEYSELVESWFETEQQLMTALRGNSETQLKLVNDQIADDLLVFLTGQQKEET